MILWPELIRQAEERLLERNSEPLGDSVLKSV
jgi:hypothetical protein